MRKDGTLTMSHSKHYETVRGIYVRTGNKDAIYGAYKKNMITADEYKTITGDIAYDKTLEGAKEAKIVESKLLLDTYFAEHPLVSKCHGGVEKTYSITEYKQNMFNRKFSAHTALVAASIPDQMTWNASGEECENWTDAECIQFIAEMNAVITPLVSAQQKLEKQINACESVEDVEAIVIDYSKIQMPLPEQPVTE